MGGIQPKHQRSAGPVRANPAAQVGAARQRTDRRRAPAAVGSAVFMRWAGAVIQASQASARVAARAIPAALAPARDDGRSPPRGRPRPRGPGRGAGDAPSAGRGSGSAAAATVLWACGPSTARVFAVHAPDSRSVDVQTILILRDVPSFREDHAIDGSARAFGGTETVDTLPANPPLSTPCGRRGSLGVLMPETGEGTQEPAPGARASGAHAGERAARAPSGCSSRIAPGSEGIVPLETRRARDARAPFRFTQARCPQRLPWVRAPPARMPARICLRRAGGRDARAPFRFTRARRPRSVQVHGCVRLRRAYQQRLPWVRAPPARISAAPAPGARASGAHISSACPGCARLRRACRRGHASGGEQSHCA